MDWNQRSSVSPQNVVIKVGRFGRLDRNDQRVPDHFRALGLGTCLAGVVVKVKNWIIQTAAAHRLFHRAGGLVICVLERLWVQGLAGQVSWLILVMRA